ncbi:hypothetical protein KCP75_11250 [Salmonella enterica subsp. enterica]|nr:hypothetical protein KCP75_11250 [Salmonella enterica subsp. enterica]
MFISRIKWKKFFKLCDEITILRDGRWLPPSRWKGLDMDKIIAMKWSGVPWFPALSDKENKPGDVILEVRNLTSLRQPSISRCLL